MFELVAIGSVIALLMLFSRIKRLSEHVDFLRKEIGRLNAALQAMQRRREDTSEPEASALRPQEEPLRVSPALKRIVTPEPKPSEPVAPSEQFPAAEEEVFVSKADEPEELVVEPKAPVRKISQTPPFLPKRTITPQPPREPEVSVVDRVIERLKKLGPDDPDMGWEMKLGTYWIPRLGVLAIAIAVVIALTMALQRWGPPIRIGLGYGICAAMFAIAWRVEKKYPQYARVLYGGGFGLTYIVTFATYYVPFARIFETPAITLILLALLVGAWAGLAQRRRSPTIAMLTTLLGHFTIGLTTYSVENPVRVSMVGIVLLSVGSAFFLVRNRWYYVAAVGLVGSYANQFFLLTSSEGSGEPAEFALAMSVTAFYLLIFAGAEYFAPEKTRRERVPLWFRTSLMTLNTAAFFVIGTMLMSGFDFSNEYQYFFRYTLALVLLLFGLAYLQVRGSDPLFNIYMTKASVMLTLGLANQLDGESLTVSLAIETLVLLVSARRSGLVVTRVLAHALAMVTFYHAMGTVIYASTVPYDDAEFWPTSVQVALVVLAFLGCSQLYLRTNWAERSLKPGTYPLALGSFLWASDILAERPKDTATPNKPLSGLLFPYLYTAVGAFILAAYTPRLLEAGDRAVFVGLAALGFGAAALPLRSPPLGRVAGAFAALTLLWSAAYFGDNGGLAYDAPLYAAACVKGAISLLSLLAMAELARRVSVKEQVGDSEAVSIFGPWKIRLALLDKSSTRETKRKKVPGVPCFIAGIAAVVYLVLCFGLIEEGHRMLAIYIGAAMLSLAAFGLNALPIGLAGMILGVFGLGVGSIEILNSVSPAVGVSALMAVTVLGVCSERKFLRSQEGLYLHQIPFAPYVLYGMLWWLTGLFLADVFSFLDVVSAFLVAAFAAACISLVLHSNAWMAISLGFFLWGQLFWHGDAPFAEDALYRVLTASLVAVGFLGDRFFSYRRRSILCPFALVSAWFVLMRFLQIEMDPAWLATGIAIAGFGYLGYFLLFRSPTSGVFALVSGAMASAYHAFHTSGETLELAPLLFGFLLPVALWISCERLAYVASQRFDFSPPPWLSGVFVGLATALLVRMLSLVPALSEFYLTISWCVLAVVLFSVFLAFREKTYRYAGLAVLLLSGLRIVFIDTRNLEILPRILAWGVLGAVLLAISFGYFKAVALLKEETPVLQEEADE